MAGIDSIIDQIRAESKAQCDALLSEADNEANEIINSAKAACDSISKQTDDKISHMNAQAKTNSGNSARQAKRRVILDAKQEIISEVIDKAAAYIAQMPDGDYFDLLGKLLRENCQAKDGMICFNGKDLGRLTDKIRKDYEKICEDKGGTLKFSSDTVDISAGFILIYGGIEQNCSIEAIFRQDRDKLTDIVSNILFKEG